MIRQDRKFCLTEILFAVSQTVPLRLLSANLTLQPRLAEHFPGAPDMIPFRVEAECPPGRDRADAGGVLPGYHPQDIPVVIG